MTGPKWFGRIITDIYSCCGVEGKTQGERWGGYYMCHADKYISDVVGGHGAGGLKGVGCVNMPFVGGARGLWCCLKRKGCHRGCVLTCLRLSDGVAA